MTVSEHDHTPSPTCLLEPLSPAESSVVQQNLRLMTEELQQMSPFSAHCDVVMPRILEAGAALTRLPGLALRCDLGAHGTVVVSAGPLSAAAYERASRRENTDHGARGFASSRHAWAFSSLSPSTCAYAVGATGEDLILPALREASDLVRTPGLFYWSSLKLRAVEGQSCALFDLHQEPVALVDRAARIFSVNSAFRTRAARNDCPFRQTGREELEFKENDRNRRFRQALVEYFNGSARKRVKKVWRDMVVTLSPTEQRNRVLVSLMTPEAISREKLFQIGQSLGLTKRQIDCCASLFAGEDRDAYAARCSISPRTVAWTERMVRETLGVNSRWEVMAVMARYL